MDDVRGQDQSGFVHPQSLRTLSPSQNQEKVDRETVNSRSTKVSFVVALFHRTIFVQCENPVRTSHWKF